MKRKEQKRRGGTIRKGEGSEWEERKDGKGGRTEKKRRGKRKGVKNGTKKRIERERERLSESESGHQGGRNIVCDGSRKIFCLMMQIGK